MPFIARRPFAFSVSTAHLHLAALRGVSFRPSRLFIILTARAVSNHSFIAEVKLVPVDTLVWRCHLVVLLRKLVVYEQVFVSCALPFRNRLINGLCLVSIQSSSERLTIVLPWLPSKDLFRQVECVDLVE